MKGIIILSLSILLLNSIPAFSYENRWDIEQDGNDLIMKPQLDPDPSKKFRGEIDSYGDVRLRDLNGNVLRGNIDKDGYGTLRDVDGNIIKVKPR
jgi:hypothetical protein